DGARGVGAVAVAVERVVVVVVEVPADDVIDVAVLDRVGAAVAVGAVGPAAGAVGVVGGEQVAGVDDPVVVEVGDLAHALVDRVVEVAEGDQAVAVDVDEVGAAGGGDLLLVDPDVLVEVGVGVVDAGVDVGHDHRVAARGGGPGLGRLDLG